MTAIENVSNTTRTRWAMFAAASGTGLKFCRNSIAKHTVLQPLSGDWSCFDDASNSSICKCAPNYMWNS